MILLGLSGIFAYNLLFFKGLQTVEAGRGAMITGSIPAVVTLLAVVFLGERFNKIKTLGIVSAISGALIVISHGQPWTVFQGSIGTGELFMTGCVLSWAIYSLLGKVLLAQVSPLVAVTCSCTIGAVFLLITAVTQGGLQEIRGLSLTGGLCILYLALFGTAIGFSWFYEGVQAFGAARAALFVNLVPVSGVLFGIFLLGEQPDSSLYVGGTLVLIGLFLINRPGKDRRMVSESKESKEKTG
jgi:drug/metabolite transporter (DMT)-like permease